MYAQVLQGSKQEIAAKILGITDEVREVIVVVEPTVSRAQDATLPATDEDIFAEMEPYMSAKQSIRGWKENDSPRH
jgi:hypothetical protein